MKNDIILALDIGQKTIGCAVSDATQTLATPIPPISRKTGGLGLGQLKRIIATYQVQTIVLGMPYRSRSIRGAVARKVRAYAGRIRRHFPGITLCYQDETLSTWSARRKYRHLHLAKGDAVINIDSFAAVEILEDYLSRLPPDDLPEGDDHAQEDDPDEEFDT